MLQIRSIGLGIPRRGSLTQTKSTQRKLATESVKTARRTVTVVDKGDARKQKTT